METKTETTAGFWNNTWRTLQTTDGVGCLFINNKGGIGLLFNKYPFTGDAHHIFRQGEAPAVSSIRGLFPGGSGCHSGINKPQQFANLPPAFTTSFGPSTSALLLGYWPTEDSTSWNITFLQQHISKPIQHISWNNYNYMNNPLQN